MGFLGLLAVIGVGWLWWKGLLGPDAGRKLALIGGTVLSLWLLGRGQTYVGLALGGATVALGFAGWILLVASAIGRRVLCRGDSDTAPPCWRQPSNR